MFTFFLPLSGRTSSLREVGVAGIRDFNTVKCLHCHLAHYVKDNCFCYCSYMVHIITLKYTPNSSRALTMAIEWVRGQSNCW